MCDEPESEASGSGEQIRWVHGHQGVAQTTQGFALESLGYYLRLKARQPAVTWLHYAPPSVAGETLEGVLIRARTFGGSYVSKVHIWDGAHQVAANDDLRVQLDAGQVTQSDDKRVPFGQLLVDLDVPHPVESGLGVSIECTALRELDGVAIVGVAGRWST